MLKDIFFYPLAALFIAIIISAALSFGDYEVLTPNQIRAQGFTVEGKNLAELTASPGTNFQYIAETPNAPAFARLVTTVARDTAPPSPGVFAALNTHYEDAFAQHRLRLTITARTSPQNGLQAFDMAYFTAGSGDSGWQRRQLTSDWANYVFEFTPGPLNDQSELDYFSIWPGDTSEPFTMDVSYMRVEVIEAP